MENIIELKNIGYSYHTLQGETSALKDISLSIKEGEFVAIVGPSGCGKSTLLSIIAGLLTPEAGSIYRKEELRMGYMLQHDHLFEWRSIYENVILGLEINHMLTAERLAYVDQLLQDYNLDKFRNAKPSELSGGMKQRAALIRTMALNPHLLLLDEPFSALDYQTRLLVSADISRLIRAAGKSMLIITHDLSEAISIADRVIVLSKRPAIVQKEIPIRLTLQDDSLLSSRNAPEFPHFFNLLWKEMSES